MWGKHVPWREMFRVARRSDQDANTFQLMLGSTVRSTASRRGGRNAASLTDVSVVGSSRRCFALQTGRRVAWSWASVVRLQCMSIQQCHKRGWERCTFWRISEQDLASHLYFNTSCQPFQLHYPSPCLCLDVIEMLWKRHSGIKTMSRYSNEGSDLIVVLQKVEAIPGAEYSRLNSTR